MQILTQSFHFSGCPDGPNSHLSVPNCSPELCRQVWEERAKYIHFYSLFPGLVNPVVVLGVAVHPGCKLKLQRKPVWTGTCPVRQLGKAQHRNMSWYNKSAEHLGLLNHHHTLLMKLGAQLAADKLLGKSRSLNWLEHFCHLFSDPEMSKGTGKITAILGQERMKTHWTDLMGSHKKPQLARNATRDPEWWCWGVWNKKQAEFRCLNSLDCWTLSSGLLAFHFITQAGTGRGKQEPRYVSALTEPGLLFVFFYPLAPASFCVVSPSGVGWKSTTRSCSGAWLLGFSWERWEFLPLKHVRDLTAPTVVGSGSSNAALEKDWIPTEKCRIYCIPLFRFLWFISLCRRL